MKTNYELILSSANNMFVHNIGFVEKRRKKRQLEFEHRISNKHDSARQTYNRRESIKVSERTSGNGYNHPHPLRN